MSIKSVDSCIVPTLFFEYTYSSVHPSRRAERFPKNALTQSGFLRGTAQIYGFSAQSQPYISVSLIIPYPAAEEKYIL